MGAFSALRRGGRISRSYRTPKPHADNKQNNTPATARTHTDNNEITKLVPICTLRIPLVQMEHIFGGGAHI